jgi:predicted pyridoxine 5'-phosphate oxidase superfamily flavin-nucleotide-binding protein
VGRINPEMRRVVEEQRLCFAATICEDGTPNLSPKGTVTVFDDDHLMFADLASPQTVKNLRTNPSIEISVVDPGVRKGFRFKGRGIVITWSAIQSRRSRVSAGLRRTLGSLMFLVPSREHNVPLAASLAARGVGNGGYAGNGGCGEPGTTTRVDGVYIAN